MSEFGVFIEEIESVEKHFNADALEVAKLKGKEFQFVVGKDNFKAGDRVFYFPVDSLIPPGLDETLGVTGKLAGSAKNRVKTVRLRGLISQGIVAPLSIYTEGVATDGVDYAEYFGVTKYEAPIKFCHSGFMKQMPEYIRSKYDIESAQRFSDVIDYLADNNIPVVILEKVEGTQLNVALDEEGFHICSRNNKWERQFDESGKPHSNIYLDVFERNPELKDFSEFLKAKGNVSNVTIRSGVVGPDIQSNIYKLNAITYYMFDIVINGKHIPFKELGLAHKEFNNQKLKVAPIIGVYSNINEYLEGSDIVSKSNGQSLINPDKLREGIVIRPYDTELYHQEIGRLILKVRSPEYLAKYDV